MDSISRGNMRLIFCHIPKTAGTTLHTYLSQFYERSRICDLEMYSRDCVGPDIERVTDAEWKRVRAHDFIYGHMGTSNVRALGGNDHRTMMVFRNPEAVLVSTYKMLRWSIDVGVDPEIDVAHQLARSGLRAFLLGDRVEVAWRINDPQFRSLRDHALFGIHETRHDGDVSTRIDPVGAEDIDEAMRRLDQLDYVGTSERLEELLQILCHDAYWPPPGRVSSQNIGPSNDAIDREVEECRLLMEDRVHHDKVIYKAVNQKLDRLYRQRFGDLDRDEANALIQRRYDEHGSGSVPRPTDDGYRFEMSERIAGDGWHNREQSPEIDETYRWMADVDANLTFEPIDRAVDGLVVTVGHGVVPSVLESLAVEIDGMGWRLSSDQELVGGAWRRMTFTPENGTAIHLGEKRWRVRFRVSEVIRTPENLDVPSDRRLLGVRVGPMEFRCKGALPDNI